MEPHTNGRNDSDIPVPPRSRGADEPNGLIVKDDNASSQIITNSNMYRGGCALQAINSSAIDHHLSPSLRIPRDWFAEIKSHICKGL
jgi:hypothetical protein